MNGTLTTLPILDDLIKLYETSDIFKNYIDNAKKLTIINLNKFLKNNHFKIEVSGFTGKQIIWHIKNKINYIPVCKECSKELRWRSGGSYGQFCSTNCSNKNIEKKNKIIKTSMEKYGVPVPSMSEQSKSKLIETNIKKYGVRSTAQLPEIKEKAKKTCLKKYNYISSSTGKINNLDKYNDSNFIIENFLDENKHFKLKEFMDYFNCGQVAAHNTLKRLNINYVKNANYSQTEKEIVNYIKEIYDGKIIENDRKTIKPKELDILIPKKNLAIEYNGLFWHSLEADKDRHLKKTEACESKNINLLHIFENEWINPRIKEIWKSVISYKLGVIKEKYFARKLEIKEITSKKTNDFFNENHLQGSCSSKINLGLYHDQELISCMAFAKPRFNKNYEYELIRFASKKFTACVGCAQRLFKYFLKKFQPKSVISYANRRWASSLNNLYKSIGFRYLRTTQPNFYYFKMSDPELKLYHRVKFQKHKLKKFPNYDSSKTAELIMIEAGYRRIYDSGNLVYEWR